MPACAATRRASMSMSYSTSTWSQRNPMDATRTVFLPSDASFCKLSSEGRKTVLVASIGFLCDHVEVLYDIDIEARRVAAQAGIHLERTASMNDQPLFIAALAEIILSGGIK